MSDFKKMDMYILWLIRQPEDHGPGRTQSIHSPPPCNLSHGQGWRPEPHIADLLRRHNTVPEGQAVNTRLIETRPGSGSRDFNLTRDSLLLHCVVKCCARVPFVLCR